MRDGFIKIAAATPDLHVADCEYNAAEIIRQAMVIIACFF